MPFANFAEALAEGRGKAQAATLRRPQQAVLANKLVDPADRPRQGRVRADQLRKVDVIFVKTDSLYVSREVRGGVKHNMRARHAGRQQQ